MKKLLIALLAIVLMSPAIAGFRLHGSAATTTNFATGSEFVPNFLYAGEFGTLNILKSSMGQNFANNNNRVYLPPTALDVNGNPIPGKGTWEAGGGANSVIYLPNPSVMGGAYDFIYTATGKGSIQFGLAPLTTVTCFGSAASNSCDNSGCSNFTASAASGVLTVTVPPTGSGCTLQANQPISGAGLSVSKFGTPVMITSAGSACGPNTCYSLNMTTLNVTSESMIAGQFFRLTYNNTQAPGNGSVNPVNWGIISSASASPIQNQAVVLATDQAAYAASATPCGHGQACIVQTAFKARVQQGGFTIMRDLDWLNGNSAACSTWESRKSINYIGHNLGELRNGAAGTMTYTLQGTTYTVPHALQYIDAAGDGASGGTVSYNSGTDTYSITVNTGNFVDKQTFEVLIPATGTSTSKISMNGNTAVPLGNVNGSPPMFFVPTTGNVFTFFYDQALNIVTNIAQDGGVQCGMPAEVFTEISAELNVMPWNVAPALALDPMTDWFVQLATVESAYTWPTLPTAAGPITEVINEIFTRGQSTCYLASVSLAHINADTNHAWQAAQIPGECGGGNVASEAGKVGSTVAQDIKSVLGSAYEVVVPIDNYFYNGAGQQDEFRSAAYLGQSMPAQTGYLKTPCYQLCTRMSLNDYWNPGASNAPNEGTEVALAFCYMNYSISSACQSAYASQQAVMTTYTASSSSVISGILGTVAQYVAWAQGFAGMSGSTINAAHPAYFYEGGLSTPSLPADVQQVVSAASNASNAMITTVDADGCITGAKVTLGALSGGTWPTATGVYTVVSSTTNTCTINLNSTGLGAIGAATFQMNTVGGNPNQFTASSVVGTIAAGMLLSPQNCIGAGTHVTGQVSGTPGGAGVYSTDLGTCFNGTAQGGPTLNYVNSANYVNYMRQASFADPSMATYTTQLYSGLVSNGGVNPSQFNLAGSYGGSWFLDSPNNFGTQGLATATCSACFISGTSLTLAGLSGAFPSGNLVTGPYTTANSLVTSSCTPVSGAVNVCGANNGDVLTLSQSAATTGGKVTASASAAIGATSVAVSSCPSALTLSYGEASAFDLTSGQLVSNQAVHGCSAGVLSFDAGISNAISSGDSIVVGIGMVGSIPQVTTIGGPGNITPNKTMKAICGWNLNGTSICGTWLLKRDLDPASNDNDPVGLEKAA